jgi:hypothetical protein
LQLNRSAVVGLCLCVVTLSIEAGLVAQYGSGGPDMHKGYYSVPLQLSARVKQPLNLFICAAGKQAAVALLMLYMVPVAWVEATSYLYMVEIFPLHVRFEGGAISLILLVRPQSLA